MSSVSQMSAKKLTPLNNFFVIVPQNEDMAFSQVPFEVHEDGIAKYLSISMMRNLFLVNKDYNIIMASKAKSNIHKNMDITYDDVLRGSINIHMFDKFIKIMRDHCDIDKLDLLFNYTIASKKHIHKYMSKDITLDPQQICSQNKFYEITLRSHENDFRVFQLLSHMANDKDGKIRDLIQTSINIQLIDYFNDLFLAKLNSVCDDTIFKSVMNITKTTRMNYNKSYLRTLSKIKISYIDINLYNIYALGLAQIIINKCKKLLSTAIIQDFRQTILENIKIYYTFYNTSEAQVNTIKLFLDLVDNSNLEASKIHLVTI
ncbi:hypothetical protein EBU71_21635, partial [bacterium]|nr:hypothetical protein [Candidatus Elulimicrobium humile]